jgi:hypothetical protein
VGEQEVRKLGTWYVVGGLRWAEVGNGAEPSLGSERFRVKEIEYKLPRLERNLPAYYGGSQLQLAVCCSSVAQSALCFQKKLPGS